MTEEQEKELRARLFVTEALLSALLEFSLDKTERQEVRERALHLMEEQHGAAGPDTQGVLALARAVLESMRRH